MKRRYNKFNPKKKIRVLSESDAAWLKELFNTVGYNGNPQHKKNPGDFKLVPPRNPREGKSLCDEIEIFRRSEALRLLREGIRHGLISESGTEKFPQNI